MAPRTSRARRPRTTKVSAAPAEAADAQTSTEPAISNDGKVPSHLAHHRMIARNLNGLLENYGELRSQVVRTEREYKRADKEIDARIFQLTTRLEALDKKLTEFIEEMTSVAFESNLKIRGNTDSLSALWDALESGGDADNVARRRRETAAREESRQAGIEQRLQELATHKTNTAREPRPSRRITKKK